MKNIVIESSISSFNRSFSKKEEYLNKRIKQTYIDINSTEVEKQIGYEKGKYRLFSFNYTELYKDVKILVEKIKEVLNELCFDANKILVVGLGNEDIVCDSLGAKVVKKLLLLPKENDYNTKNTINGIIPNVLGITGIESYDIIMGVVNQINPDLVIVIDTLSANNYDSLFKSIQISNTSITPGSGVKNARKKLSQKSLNKPLIIFGIPMLISIKNLLNSFDLKTKKNISEDMWFSPKDVDFAVEEFSYIIAKSINEYFYPDIKPNTIEKLVKGIF